MTVNTAQSTATYTGNAVTTGFAIPFYFLANTDLVVLQLVAATGVVHTLVLNSDYTLTGAGVEAGGSLTMAVAPATGDTLYIARDVIAVQQTAYPSNSPFPAASHEMALDRLTMLVQQLQTAQALTLTRDPLLSTYDLQGNTLINEALAVNPSDVPNFSQVQGMIVGGAAPLLAGPTGSSLVGFQQAGTGATARTSQAKMRDILSVMDFGATGNGVTDDTAAIRAALVYADSLAPGVGLFFPSGTYNISGTLSIPAGVRCYGEGRNATWIVPTVPSIAAFSCINATATIVCIGLSNLSIYTKQASVVGVQWTLCRDTYINDVNFYGCAQNFVIDRGQCHSVTNCIASGVAGSNPCGSNRVWSSVDTDYVYDTNITNFDYFNIGNGCNNGADVAMLYVRRAVTLYVSGLHAGDLATGGTPCAFMWFENDCQGCKITSCIGTNATYGLTMQQGTGVVASPSFMEFIGLDIDQPSVCAVNLISCSWINFIGGVITPNSAHENINVFLLQVGTLNVTIANVIIEGFNVSGGVAFYFNGCSYVTVTGCRISNVYTAVTSPATANHIKFISNQLSGVTTKINGSIAQAGMDFTENPGLNPITVTTPAFPAASTTYTNNLGTKCSVYITGGTITAYAINGQGVGGLAGPQTIQLAPGETINTAYSGTPAWTWIGH